MTVVLTNLSRYCQLSLRCDYMWSSTTASVATHDASAARMTSRYLLLANSDNKLCTVHKLGQYQSITFNTFNFFSIVPINKLKHTCEGVLNWNYFDCIDKNPAYGKETTKRTYLKMKVLLSTSPYLTSSLIGRTGYNIYEFSLDINY